MYKIAAFITFEKKLEKKIITQKLIVKRKFGNQIYLNHPVHLTLFTIKINKISLLKKIYQKIKRYKLFNSIKFQTNKAGVFLNDPLTNGHTLYYGLKKNNLLMKAQLKHLKYINRNMVVEKNKNNFNDRTMNKNYKKYGFPFAGKIWVPHITVSSIGKIKKNNIFIKRFLRSKINFKSSVKYIKFYRVIKDKHQYLFETNII